MPMREERRETDDKGDAARVTPNEAPSERAQIEKLKEVVAKNTSSPAKPYQPPVPYPQRLVKARKEHKYGKFL